MGEIKIEHSRFGHIIIEPQEYVSVKDIRAPDKEFCITIEHAEQITLISGNENIQVCVKYNGPGDFQIYLLHHQTGSIAAIAKLKEINYKGVLSAPNYFHYPVARF